MSSLIEGYEPKQMDVTVPTGGPINFALNTAGQCPQGYTSSGDGFLQTFDEPTTPAGWTVTNNIPGLGTTWEFDDPYARTNLTGGSGGFAIVDSDQAGTGVVFFQDTELISPSVNLTGASTVTLEFDTDFRWFDGGLDEQADVDVSTDGGTTWTNVWKRSGADYRGPRHETVNISAIANNKPDVKVRFYYYNANFDYWWQVDNVALGNKVCTPKTGGLVVGDVASSAGFSGINGATVTRVGAPGDTATTIATPDDPAVPDGWYALFVSATGPVSIRATAPSHNASTRSVTVAQGAIAQLRFVLKRV